MGKNCVVTFCKSGYQSQKQNEEGKKEKISIFSVPNDQKTIERQRRERQFRGKITYLKKGMVYVKNIL